MINKNKSETIQARIAQRQFEPLLNKYEKSTHT